MKNRKFVTSFYDDLTFYMDWLGCCILYITTLCIVNIYYPEHIIVLNKLFEASVYLFV